MDSFTSSASFVRASLKWVLDLSNSGFRQVLRGEGAYQVGDGSKLLRQSLGEYFGHGSEAGGRSRGCPRSKRADGERLISWCLHTPGSPKVSSFITSGTPHCTLDDARRHQHRRVDCQAAKNRGNREYHYRAAEHPARTVGSAIQPLTGMHTAVIVQTPSGIAGRSGRGNPWRAAVRTVPRYFHEETPRRRQVSMTLARRA